MILILYLSISIIICVVFNKKLLCLLQQLSVIKSGFFVKWRDAFSIGILLASFFLKYKFFGYSTIHRMLSNKYSNPQLKQYALWYYSKMCMWVYLTVFFVLCGLPYSVYYVWLSLCCGFGLIYNEFSNVKQEVALYRSRVVSQLPNVITELILLLQSGQPFLKGWHLIAQSNSGEFYDDMKNMMNLIEHGQSMERVFTQYLEKIDDMMLRKFISLCIESKDKGSRDMVPVLMLLLEEVWLQQKNKCLREAQKVNQQLLLPAALIFIGVLIILIGPMFMMGII